MAICSADVHALADERVRQPETEILAAAADGERGGDGEDLRGIKKAVSNRCGDSMPLFCLGCRFSDVGTHYTAACAGFELGFGGGWRECVDGGFFILLKS